MKTKKLKFKIYSQNSLAFTMIELIIVIIIIGILSSVAISKFPNHRLNNDVNYLSMQINQKRENALNYDHYKFGDTLWKKRDYSKEYNLTCIDLNITGQRELYGKSSLDQQEDAKNLSKHYHIDRQTRIEVVGLDDTNQSLCFDNLGRPYTMEQKLLDKIIVIKAVLGKKSKEILVFPQSGYVIIKRNN